MTYIDLYCERTGPEFWNEPLNALSNLAFVIAAYFAWRTLQRRQNKDMWECLVIALAALIGIGSFLFHTFAQKWAEWTDVIPIWSFVAAFVVLTIYRLSNGNRWKTARISLIASGIAATVVYFTGADISSDDGQGSSLFNGSIQYAPALLALILFTTITYWRKHPIRQHLLLATVTFTFSLLFRSIDLLSCEATYQLGTHFLWHIGNAAMIYLLLQALVLKMPSGIRLPKH